MPYTLMSSEYGQLGKLSSPAAVKLEVAGGKPVPSTETSVVLQLMQIKNVTPVSCTNTRQNNFLHCFQSIM